MAIKQDKLTKFCLYIDCKYERRLKSQQCNNCQMHKHKKDNGTQYVNRKSNYLTPQEQVYRKLCGLEYHILNKTDLCFLKEQIKYGKSLIINILYLEKMSEKLQFKIFQISQLLNHNIQDNDSIKEFLQFNQQTQENKITLIENTYNYKISKAYKTSSTNVKFHALSPNQKYFLLGILKYVYVYDISKKRTINVYKDAPQLCQFTNSSNSIIQAFSHRLVIQNFKTNRKININFNQLSMIKKMQVFKNQLHMIQEVIQEKYKTCVTTRLVKFCLVSNRLMFSQVLREGVEDQIFLSKDQISFITQQYLYITNLATRKVQQKIDLQDYHIQKLIVLNNYEILSQLDRQLQIWNIDYKYNCLIKKYIITPVDLEDDYVEYFDEFFLSVVNKKILRIDHAKMMIPLIKENQIQLPNKLFIVFQEGWICILQRRDI